MTHDLGIRRSSRLMIVSPNDKLLLFRYEDEHEGAFWSTVGGELQGNETYLDAARRELHEETGYSAPIGSFLRERDAVYAVARSQPARWIEHYFLVTVDSQTPPNVVNWTDEERATITAFRWWSHDELAQQDTVRKPVWIPDLFREILIASGTER